MKYCPNCGQQVEEDVRFCPFCGASVTRIIGSEAETVSSEEPHHTAKAKGKIVFASVLILLALCMLVYTATYLSAIRLADNMKYKAAARCLIVPQLTELHDPQFAEYINSCKLLIAGDTFGAQEEFEKFGDYLQSEQMSYECRYVRGVQYMDEGEYWNAAYVFGALLEIAPDYSNTGSMLLDALKGYYYACDSNEDFLSCIRYLNKYKAYGNGIEEFIAEITPVFYEKAVSAYRNGEYKLSYDYFTELPEYSDSGKYELLLSCYSLCTGQSADFSSYASIFPDSVLSSHYPNLLKIVNFENANELLVCRTKIALLYLDGKWEGSEGELVLHVDWQSNRFNIKEIAGAYITISIPNHSFIAFRFDIIEGVLKLPDDQYRNDMFSFTVIDADTIDVNCSLDNTTYRLYRQQ